MNILSFFFLGLIAFASAKHHKKCGGKGGMGMLKFMKGGDFPGCFKSLSMTEDQKKKANGCHKEMKNIAADINGTESLTNAFLDLVQCNVDAFGVVADDGTLDVTKLLAEVDTFTGPEELKAELKTLTQTCYDELQPENDNATLLMADIMQCKLKGLLTYCTETEGQDPGELSWFVPMMTLGDESVCESVNVSATIKPTLEKCLADAGIDPCGMKGSKEDSSSGEDGSSEEECDEDDGGKRRGRGPPGRRGPKGPGGRGGGGRGGRGRGGRSRGGKGPKGDGLKGKKDEMQMMVSIMKCIGTELGYVNEADETDYTALGEVVKAFPGFSELDETTQTSLNTAITECGTGAVFGEDFTTVMIEASPWLNMIDDDFVKQGIMFTRCFMPQYGEICGIQNELSFFFFPMLHKILPKVIKDEILADSWKPDCP